MRIIVTPVGRRELKKSSSEKKNILRPLLLDIPNQRIEEIPKPVQNPNIKLIPVKTNKILLPKNQLALYEKKSFNNRKNLLPQLTHFNLNPHYYSYKDIFGEKTAEQMKDKFEKEIEEKRMKRALTEGNLRMDEEKKENLNEIFEMKRISKHEVNLINYLKDCGKQFSFYQIKRIIIQDDHQMNKMNQICKKTTAKQEERNILSNVINTKLEEKKRKEKLSYKKGIVLLGKEISEIKVRMNRYTKPQKKSLSLYKDKQKIYKKYWDKYNIDKLY